MADAAQTDTQPDKALTAQGADQIDTSDHEGGDGNPSPDAPPATDPGKGKDKEDATPADDTSEDDGAGDAEETSSDDTPLDTDAWGTTGDEVGDSVLQLLQNSGLSVDDAKSLMFDAMKSGDVTKVDRDALIEKVGKAKASLILAGAENYVSRASAKANTIKLEVHKTVGGEDNWNAITTWAKSKVPASDLNEYRTMIDAGGAQARFAASELANRFNADDANTTLSASEEVLQGDALSAPTQKATTKQQYVAAISDAYARNASEQEINAIKAARARGRAQGI